MQQIFRCSLAVQRHRAQPRQHQDGLTPPSSRAATTTRPQPPDPAATHRHPQAPQPPPAGRSHPGSATCRRPGSSRRVRAPCRAC